LHTPSPGEGTGVRVLRRSVHGGGGLRRGGRLSSAPLAAAAPAPPPPLAAAGPAFAPFTSLGGHLGARILLRTEVVLFVVEHRLLRFAGLPVIGRYGRSGSPLLLLAAAAAALAGALRLGLFGGLGGRRRSGGGCLAGLARLAGLAGIPPGLAGIPPGLAGIPPGLAGIPPAGGGL